MYVCMYVRYKDIVDLKNKMIIVKVQKISILYE